MFSCIIRDRYNGCKCRLDGRNVDIQDALGCYIGIEIPAGFSGEVELSFASPWRVLGFICFIFTFGLLIIDIRFQIVERLGRCTIMSKIVAGIYFFVLLGIVMAYGLNVLMLVV